MLAHGAPSYDKNKTCGRKKQNSFVFQSAAVSSRLGSAYHCRHTNGIPSIADVAGARLDQHKAGRVNDVALT